ADSKIQFEFLDDELNDASTLKELRVLRAQIDKRYQDFITGKCLIKAVIRSPLELVQYTFIYLMEELALPIKDGFRVQLKFTLPIGCGMGASAAMILSLMHALVSHFGYS
ncbi:hypothetical protein MEO41_28780, partial [Dolichospermum sp. ST_sed4]|nr:hypothetical protein [Dolichospermum sp. ST_sed4]